MLALPSSSQSLIQTFSRRFDNVSGAVCAVSCVCAVLLSLATLGFLVVPNIGEASELRQQLELQRAELAALKETGRKLYVQVNAMDDPYNVYRIARDVWGFQPEVKPAAKRPR